MRRRSAPLWTDLLELAAVGAMALGLLAATVVVLLVDEPAFRRAIGSPAVTDGAPAVASAAGADERVERGRMLFQASGCVGCHVGPGVSAGWSSSVGPNLALLSQVAATRRPGMGADAYVAESIREPGAFIVPGYERDVVMPRLGLAPADVDALVHYLRAESSTAVAPVAPLGATSGPMVGMVGGGPEPPGPPRLADRTFSPSPPGAAYPTVWAGDEVTMTLVFAEGPQPTGEVVTHFVEDDGQGALTVTVRAEPVGDRTWRARLVLPRPGRWEGRHDLGAGLDASPPPFALRVLRPGG